MKQLQSCYTNFRTAPKRAAVGIEGGESLVAGGLELYAKNAVSAG